jgi:hypothetical protein
MAASFSSWDVVTNIDALTNVDLLLAGGSAVQQQPSIIITGPPFPNSPPRAPGQFITHVTTAGERWDTLAWRYYGDPTLFGPIIQTNPQVPVMAVFDAGLVIGVPLLTVNLVVQAAADLPPWKQVN